MGRLLYGSPPTVHVFDDRDLAHLQVVITTRFRRAENFLLTIDGDAGTPRRELWMNPAIPTQYEYDTVRPPVLNTDWLRLLTSESNGRAGLHLVPEPQAQLSAASPRAAHG